MSNDIAKMNDKQLRKEVQLLRDEIAIMKRKYEDILYNLDTDNFSSRFVKEQGDMKTAIEVNAEGIKTKVSDKELQSSIEQTAAEIRAEVENVEAGLSSEITQTASEIRGVVSRATNVKFKMDVRPTNANTTEEQKAMLCEYNGELYYFNDISNQWKISPYSDVIKSQFIQTEDGFELSGDVAISGDLVTHGKISGDIVEGGTIRGSTIQTHMSNEPRYGTYAELNADNGSLDFYYKPSNGEPILRCSMWQSGGYIFLRPFDAGELYIGNYADNSGMHRTHPIGEWDFSDCTPLNLNVPARFG